jgi:hypothetical protein
MVKRKRVRVRVRVRFRFRIIPNSKAKGIVEKIW